jgi:hypothetical protein
MLLLRPFSRVSVGDVPLLFGAKPLSDAEKRRARRRRNEKRPLETQVVINRRRCADLPSEVRLPLNIAKRTKAWVEAWVRRHPSQALRDWMDFTRLRIDLVPGFWGSKGNDIGLYQESRNRVLLCPVLLSDDGIQRRYLTRKNVERVLAHEIEGHFLEALPAFIGSRIRNTRGRLQKSFFSDRPHFPARLEGLLDTYLGKGLTGDPALCRVYRAELAKISPKMIRDSGYTRRAWTYVTDLHELIAFTAQFDAEWRTLRLQGKLEIPKKLFEPLKGAPGSVPLAFRVTTFFPKTIELIRKHRKALLGVA